MKISFVKWLGLIVALALAVPALAQTTVNQGQGQSSGSKPWVVSIGGSSASGGSVSVGAGKIKSGAPTATVTTSAVSAAAIAITTGGCFRVACTATTFYRTGTATPTALTTDNPIFGPGVEKVCLQATDTALAFVQASGTGTCTVSLLN
jgi:hypothetical protein